MREPSWLSQIFCGPVLLAPAMNGKMYEHEAVQKNLEILKGRGMKIIEPVVGELACGYEGIGKLAPLEKIANRLIKELT